MFNRYTEIDVNEIPSLIEGLVKFLGRKNVKDGLQKYRKSLEFSKSSPIYRDYFLKSRHPWWEAIIQFNHLRKTQQQLTKPLPLPIKLLAYDAKKILTLQKTMPGKVRHKYMRDFLDNNSARSYLFEIDTAWMFYKKGWSLIWSSQETTKTIPEFIAHKGNSYLQVECKKIGVDTSYKIRRQDFYRLMDLIAPQLAKLNLMGKVDIVLNENCRIDDDLLRSLSKRIARILKENRYEYSGTDSDISILMNLLPRANIIVNPVAIYKDFHNRIQNSHGIVLFADYEGHTVDPIEINMRAEESENLGAIIYNILKKTARSQMTSTKPGFIACHMSEIPSFGGLVQNSGFSAIVQKLFSREDTKHIVAVTFVSDMRVRDWTFVQISQSPGLFFRNETSPYRELLDLDFLN